MIGIGSWGIFYYKYKKDGNYHAPIVVAPLRPLTLQSTLSASMRHNGEMARRRAQSKKLNKLSTERAETRDQGCCQQLKRLKDDLITRQP